MTEKLSEGDSEVGKFMTCLMAQAIVNQLRFKEDPLQLLQGTAILYVGKSFLLPTASLSLMLFL